MNNFCKATTATAVAAAFAMLLVGAQQPASAQQTAYGPSAVQIADRADNENGDNENNDNQNNCTNPGGNQRGWCKQDNERRQCLHNHRSDRDDCGRGRTFVSGTVLGWNGNRASFRLDSGRVITLVDNAGGLAVGGHYRLAGHYGSNGVFVVGNNNGNYGNGNYGNGNYGNGNYGNGNYGSGGQAASQISGTVMSVGQDTVTLVGVPPVTINVRQAISRGATNGSLFPGRHITAYGYYSNGIFYATTLR